MPVVRSARLIFFMLRKDMTRGCLVLDSVRHRLNETSLWSEMGRSAAEQFLGVKPEQQTKSKVCPLQWVGKSIYCVRPKLSRHEMKSLVDARLLLSR